MVKLVSEGSNRYTHLFLVEREYFGFNTLESAIVECVIIFLDNFIFLCAIHEKHDFKYLKNSTVKVCKIQCNDVYMYIFFTVTFFGGRIRGPTSQTRENNEGVP
jgi:hypothetical protein